MPNIKLFNDLDREERLDFFQRCQDMLVKHNPNSPYIMRYGSPVTKSYFFDVFLRYQGILYETDKIIVMFNKHRCSGREEIIEKYRENLFLPPHPEPNTYSIDFVSSSQLNKEILTELKPFFSDDGMEYISFLRGQNLTVFDIESFRKSMIMKFFDEEA